MNMLKTNIEALTLAVRLVRIFRSRSLLTRAAAQTASGMIKFICKPHEPAAGEPFYFVPFCLVSILVLSVVVVALLASCTTGRYTEKICVNCLYAATA